MLLIIAGYPFILISVAGVANWFFPGSSVCLNAVAAAGFELEDK